MRYMEAIQYGLAPRLGAGLMAARKALADDEWHTSAEVRAAVEQTGLAPRTAENLLREMLHSGQVNATRDPADPRRRVYRLHRGQAPASA